MRGGKKKQTIKAQSLEAKALKYAMMKELTSNADMINDGTFFDAKRDQEKNTSSTLFSQLIE